MHHLQLSDNRKNNTGLFGVVNGTIKNLTVSKFTIRNNGNSNHGAIVGKLSGTIENCHAKDGAVWGNNNTGGLVGVTPSTATIKNCTTANNVTVTWNGDSKDSRTSTGGIVGLVESNTSIENCTNNAAIVKKNSGDVFGFGGIVGYSTSSVTIKNCTNNGTITGSNEVGGIIGHTITGNILNCTNNGNVSANAVVGGIVGKIVSGEVTGGKNTGEITSTGTRSETAGTAAYLGGIVGLAQCAVSNCYVAGRVAVSQQYKYSDIVGGVAGYTNANVEHCYVSATVVGSNSIGSVAGHRGGGQVRYCYYSGTLECLWNDASAKAGYFVGTDSDAVLDCWRLPGASVVPKTK